MKYANNRNDLVVYLYRTIQDPASQRLTWYKPPLTVLVIKKIRDPSVLPPFVQMVTWLIEVNVNKIVPITLSRKKFISSCLHLIDVDSPLSVMERCKNLTRFICMKWKTKNCPRY